MAPLSRSHAGLHEHSHAAGLKSLVAMLLIVFVALAPVPAGSNRPIFWALAAGLLSVIAILYFAGVLWSGASVRLRGPQAGIPLALLFLMVIYLLIQVLPLGGPISELGLSELLGPVKSEMISLAPGATVLMMLQFATYGLFGILMLEVSLDRTRAIWITHALFYVITAHATYALLALTQLGDTVLILQKWAYEGDATGTFINRNSFATFLAFGLAVGFSLLLRGIDSIRSSSRGIGHMRGSTDWPGVAIVGVCMLILAAALFATKSRLGVISAFAGLAAGLTVYVSRTQKGVSPALLVGALASAGVMVWLYGGGFLERLGSLQSSADVRGALYAQVAGMIEKRPLVGYGGGSFEITYPMFHRLPVSPDLIWDKAHSTYLGLWADLGLIFGTVPMLIVAFAAFRLLRIAATRHRDWAMPLAGFSTIIVAAVHSIGDFSLEIEANAIAFVAIVAVSMATPTKKQLRGEP